MRKLLLLLPLAAGPVRAQSVDATVDKLVAAYAKMRTVRASFEQTLTNPLTGTTAVARGEMQQERPSRLSVRFTDPAGDRIVADGKFVWLYLPSTNPGQVIKMPLGDNAATVDLTAEFLESPRSRFDITDAGTTTVGGRATRALTLVPKGTSGDFARATVWVDTATGTLQQFEVTDANGLVRRVRLTEVRLNVPVDRSAFRFRVPRGVSVVEQGH